MAREVGRAPSRVYDEVKRPPDWYTPLNPDAARSERSSSSPSAAAVRSDEAAVTSSTSVSEASGAAGSSAGRLHRPPFPPCL